MTEETRWRDWLRLATGETSTRKIAAKIGRSHTSVQRWMRVGIPPAVVFEVAVRFQVDLCETVVMVGWLDTGDIARANVQSTVRLMPAEALTGELHRRALECRQLSA